MRLCWAFSAAEALEGQLGLNGAPGVSARQLVDCVKLDFGCNGGWMDDALAYAEKHGVQNDTTYPYNATTQPCAADPSDATVRPTFYVEVPKSDVALREALVLFGPVSIALDATMAFQSYAGGVLTDDTCDPTTPDHALLLVGYNSVDGYWVIKNSWGPAWGRDGYVYMNGDRRRVRHLVVRRVPTRRRPRPPAARALALAPGGRGLSERRRQRPPWRPGERRRQRPPHRSCVSHGATDVYVFLRHRNARPCA